MERVLTPMVDNAVPNPAHFACVTLEEQGRLVRLLRKILIAFISGQVYSPLPYTNYMDLMRIYIV